MWSRPIPSPWHVYKDELMKLDLQRVSFIEDARRMLNGARLYVSRLYSITGVDWLIAAGINFSSTTALRFSDLKGLPSNNDEKSQRVQDHYPGHESLSGESEIDEKVPDEKQNLRNKVLSGGELRWMRRRHRHNLEERADSITTSSTDENSRNSGIDTFSDRNSSSGSELSELAIHTLLVETRARDLDREVYQDPDSDCYLIPSERVFDNTADDLETIAVSKRLVSLLPQKEVVRSAGLISSRSSKKRSRWRRFGALRWKKTHTNPMS